MIIDGGRREVEYTGAFWYLAHFSKFVRPGSVRIDSTGTVDGIAHTAFRAPDGTVIVQLVNSGSERRIAIGVLGGHVEIDAPARGIATVRLPNL